MKKIFLLIPFLGLCLGVTTAISSSSPSPKEVEAMAFEDTFPYVDEDEGIHYQEADVLVDYGSFKTSSIYKTVYSDEAFFHPSDTYSHFLARQSIGLALSSFHLYDETADLNEEDFWDKMNGTLFDYFAFRGFDDIRIDDYFKETSLYTVGTAIARKDIEMGDQKASLIAVAIRGGNYKNEWQSNLTVDGGMRHEGFNEAATLVTDRILSFYGQTHFDYPVKIWLAGFSRAGAITNLVAANLNDSAVFNKEQVYAYTFAAPRAVWHPEGGVNPYAEGYENIFNIVGASDMIPQFVPGEWNYYHYGIDKELPGCEFDSTFLPKYAVIQEKLARLNAKTYYNPQLNLRLRMLYGLLLELATDEFTFTAVLQPVFLKILQNKQIANLVMILRDTAIEWRDKYPQHATQIDGVLDFVLGTLHPLLMGGSYVEGQQSSSKNPVFRLLHEHFPELYLYMLYNFKENELFNCAKEFAYVTFTGGTLVIKEGATKQEVIRIQKGRRTLTKYAEDAQIDFPIWETSGKTMFALPYDRDYEVSYEVDAGSTFSAQIVPYGRVFSSKLIKSVIESKENGLLLTVNGRTAIYETELNRTNPTEYIHYLGIQSDIFSYRAYLIGASTILSFVVILILWLFLILNARIAKKKIRPLRIALLSLFIFFTIGGEFAFWFVAAAVYVGVLCKIAAGLCILGLYLHGKDLKIFKRPHKTILPFFVLAITGNVLLSVIFPLGVGFLIAALGYMNYYYLREKRPKAHHWILYGVLAVVVTGLMFLFVPPTSVNGIVALIGLAAALLLCFTSSMHGDYKQIAGFLMLPPMMFLTLYLHSTFALFSSLVYVGAFAVAMVVHMLYFDQPEANGIDSFVKRKDDDAPAIEESAEASKA